MSHQLYASNAERQRAFRQRQHAARTSAPLPARTKVPADPSRPVRLALLTAEARKLAAEYQNWLDRLPTNLQAGQVAAHLEDVVAQLDEACAILEAIEPPTVGRPAGVP